MQPLLDTALSHAGYPMLFVWSFLAATIVPVGSEVMLVALLTSGFAPWPVVGVASVGNTLGGMTTWALGRAGADTVLRRWLRLDAEKVARAEGLFARYGLWALLLTWTPGVGDVLCLVAGMLRVPIWRFVGPVWAGKTARYAMVAWVTLAGVAATR